MRAFLMAAGKGTRLRPLTDTIPKCLVPIGSISLLEIWVTLLDRAGIEAVLVNTHHLAQQVQDAAVSLNRKYRIDVQTVYEPELLGSAGTLSANSDFIPSGQDFLVAYGDNLTDLPLGPMIEFHRRQPADILLTIGLFRAPDPTACGIAVLDDDYRVKAFEEKPSHPQSDLANAGIYVARYGLFDACAAVRPCSGPVFDFGHHVLPRLVGQMAGYEIGAYLKDIGTMTAYRQAQLDWATYKGDKHGNP